MANELMEERTFSPIHLAATSEASTPAHALMGRLTELFHRLDEPHSFTKGQFVAWKPSLKNRKFPEYGEPVIVTAILPAPIFDPSEAASGSPYFQEPLTLVVGVCRDDDLLEFRVDGRRFEPCKGEMQ